MIVNGLIYGMFLGGVLLSQYPLLMSTLHGLLFRLRIRADLIRRPETARYRAYGPFLSHICKLTESTGMSGLFGRPEVFVRISVLLGAGIAGALNWVTGPVFAVITGIFSALLPYLGLRLKLNQKRVSSSREGDTMLRELLSCYKIHDSNMKEAIEAAAAGLEGAPHAKRLLYDLAGGLNRSYTREDIRRELDVFRYSLDTAWGGALTQIIYFAMVRGIRVTDSLEDLTVSLIRSREVVEHAKRENSESVLMLRYLAPICYLLSVFCACRFFGFTPARFLHYQFGTKLGLEWFIILTGAFVLGTAVSAVLSREKMDI